MSTQGPESVREFESYAKELTKDWPAPESPEQLRVVRRVFGPHLSVKREAS